LHSPEHPTLLEPDLVFGWRDAEMRRIMVVSHELTIFVGGCVAEKLAKGARISGGVRDRLASDLKRKYEGGKSIRDLAGETGRSYGFVHRLLSESGVELRGRGGATRGRKKRS
jgi:hypothetical protein